MQFCNRITHFTVANISTNVVSSSEATQLTSEDTAQDAMKPAAKIPCLVSPTPDASPGKMAENSTLWHTSQLFSHRLPTAKIVRNP